MDSAQAKWQPVMLIATHRIECGRCGALAVFVILDDEHDSEPDAVHTGESDWGYSAWCQECYTRAQDEDEEEDHDAPPSHDAA